MRTSGVSSVFYELDEIPLVLYAILNTKLLCRDLSPSSINRRSGITHIVSSFHFQFSRRTECSYANRSAQLLPVSPLLILCSDLRVKQEQGIGKVPSNLTTLSTTLKTA